MIFLPKIPMTSLKQVTLLIMILFIYIRAWLSISTIYMIMIYNEKDDDNLCSIMMSTMLKWLF